MNYLEFVPNLELKSLHTVLLDLFKEFRRVCKKYNLKFVAEGGTLLGAVRHNGFIPWDDDMDIAMMYDDYVKLLEIPPNEFRQPYYLQSYKSDVYAEISAARLRNSLTTGCTKWEFDNLKVPSHNKGIFLDIFPLFPVSSSEKIRSEQKKKLDQLWRAIRGWNAMVSINSGYKTNYSEYIPDWQKFEGRFTIGQIKQQYMDACNNFAEKRDFIGETSFRMHSEKCLWPEEWFKEIIELPFEDTTIPCPKMYDEILTKTFGDWRTPVYNSSCHEMYILDIDTPWHMNKEITNIK